MPSTVPFLGEKWHRKLTSPGGHHSPLQVRFGWHHNPGVQLSPVSSLCPWQLCKPLPSKRDICKPIWDIWGPVFVLSPLERGKIPLCACPCSVARSSEHTLPRAQDCMRVPASGQAIFHGSTPIVGHNCCTLSI